MATQFNHAITFNFEKEVEPIIKIIQTKLLEQVVREIEYENTNSKMEEELRDLETEHFTKVDHKISVFVEKK